MKEYFKKIVRTCLDWFSFWGFNPRALLNNIGGLPFYVRDLLTLVRQKGKDTTFSFGPMCPALNERRSESGIKDFQYFYQDLFIASKIFKAGPKRHVDIASRIDGFVAHVAVFREIEVYDIRPQSSKVKNIVFKECDLTCLPEHLLNSCDSISALHSIEHFGLGRYGDPVDYYGSQKAIENIHKILSVGGKFYFSVPIGKQRIEFNALRVFSVLYLLHLFEGKFIVNGFSYVDDKGGFFENVELVSAKVEKNFDCNCGLGIFELTKI